MREARIFKEYADWLIDITRKKRNGLKEFFVKNKVIAELYKNRWSVELFFKWLKQHLHVKEFYGTSENAVNIQLYSAIITYCLSPSWEVSCI